MRGVQVVARHQEAAYSPRGARAVVDNALEALDPPRHIALRAHGDVGAPLHGVVHRLARARAG